jgi:putative FmdB family regulatory protein
MPVYEYECAACGHQFEEWQKISDAPVKTCPKCKKKKVERLISQTAFQLKGGGWYKDLYSSGGKSKSDSNGSSSDAGSSASKAESKASDGGGSKDSSSTASSAASKADGKSTKPAKASGAAK